MLEMSNADAEFLYSVRLLSGVLVGLGVLIIGEIPYSLFFHKKIDVNNEAVTSMSDVKTETTYFESGGRHNTKSALKLVRERALKQNIRNIVIASIRGQSVDIALEIFCGTDIDLTIVGCDGCDACPPFSKSAKQRAEDAEHRVIFAPEGSIPYPAEAQFAFRRICEGMKVCVHLAMAVAEYFRDQGKDVLFMMDSVTRFAHAQREIGLAVGEPPATKGYTPSVFAILPKLLERSGMSEQGSITGIFAVLVEADDVNEPISDAVRGVLDGHIVLSRKLAQRNQYPAVDVLASISRLTPYITTEEHRQAIERMKQVLSYYYDAEDLIQIGAYVRGSDPKVDWAIEKIDQVNQFLMQGIEEGFPFEDITTSLCGIFEDEDKQ